MGAVAYRDFPYLAPDGRQVVVRQGESLDAHPTLAPIVDKLVRTKYAGSAEEREPRETVVVNAPKRKRGRPKKGE